MELYLPNLTWDNKNIEQYISEACQEKKEGVRVFVPEYYLTDVHIAPKTSLECVTTLILGFLSLIIKFRQQRGTVEKTFDISFLQTKEVNVSSYSDILQGIGAYEHHFIILSQLSSTSQALYPVSSISLLWYSKSSNIFSLFHPFSTKCGFSLPIGTKEIETHILSFFDCFGLILFLLFEGEGEQKIKELTFKSSVTGQMVFKPYKQTTFLDWWAHAVTSVFSGTMFEEDSSLKFNPTAYSTYVDRISFFLYPHKTKKPAVEIEEEYVHPNTEASLTTTETTTTIEKQADIVSKSESPFVPENENGEETESDNDEEDEDEDEDEEDVDEFAITTHVNGVLECTAFEESRRADNGSQYVACLHDRAIDVFLPQLVRREISSLEAFFVPDYVVSPVPPSVITEAEYEHLNKYFKQQKYTTSLGNRIKVGETITFNSSSSFSPLPPIPSTNDLSSTITLRAMNAIDEKRSTNKGEILEGLKTLRSKPINILCVPILFDDEDNPIQFLQWVLVVVNRKTHRITTFVFHPTHATIDPFISMKPDQLSSLMYAYQQEYDSWIGKWSRKLAETLNKCEFYLDDLCCCEVISPTDLSKINNNNSTFTSPSYTLWELKNEYQERENEEREKRNLAPKFYMDWVSLPWMDISAARQLKNRLETTETLCVQLLKNIVTTPSLLEKEVSMKLVNLYPNALVQPKKNNKKKRKSPSEEDDYEIREKERK
jgi:hypothetical protein